MKIKVYYPSGNVLHLSGQWKGPGNVNGVNVILILIDKDCHVPQGSKAYTAKSRKSVSPIIEAGSAFVGDPRGVYQDEETKELLFNPRGAMVGMEQWAVAWLNKHPEWPGVLDL